MQRLKRHLTYANVAATLALVIAVAGIPTAIAISKGAKSSDVNKKGNIRTGRVTARKLATGSVTAAKLAGIDIVQQGGNPQVTASCPVGERLLSGGAFGADIRVSEPTPEGNGWTVVAVSGGVRATALCLKASPGS